LLLCIEFRKSIVSLDHRCGVDRLIVVVILIGTAFVENEENVLCMLLLSLFSNRWSLLQNRVPSDIDTLPMLLIP